MIPFLRQNRAVSPGSNNPGNLPILVKTGRIRIRPTRFGVLFLVLLAAMLFGSIRYNNNLGFLLTFLLGTMALGSLRQTRRNLEGIGIEGVKTAPVFAGEQALWEVELHAPAIERRGVAVAFEKIPARESLLPADRTTRVRLRTLPLIRGRFAPGDLILTTRYPLGIFKAGTALQFAVTGLVYPAPAQAAAPATRAGSGRGGSGKGSGVGVDDFKGLRDYQPGDPLQHIHWKSYSRGLGLHVKEFEDSLAEEILFDWHRCRGATEQRLSRLCRAVLQASAHSRAYGLKLPGVDIQPGRGPHHARRCLAALALFGETREAG